MADIKTHLNNIKGALYGKDVRGSIYDGIDAINTEVENTTGRQVDLENTFDQLVINAGNSNAEIVDARVKNDGTSYSKLGDRLDAVDSQLVQIKAYVTPLMFGGVGDGESDDSKALQACLDLEGKVEIDLMGKTWYSSRTLFLNTLEKTIKNGKIITDGNTFENKFQWCWGYQFKDLALTSKEGYVFYIRNINDTIHDSEYYNILYQNCYMNGKLGCYYAHNALIGFSQTFIDVSVKSELGHGFSGVKGPGTTMVHCINDGLPNGALFHNCFCNIMSSDSNAPMKHAIEFSNYFNGSEAKFTHCNFEHCIDKGLNATTGGLNINLDGCSFTKTNKSEIKINTECLYLISPLKLKLSDVIIDDFDFGDGYYDIKYSGAPYMNIENRTEFKAHNKSFYRLNDFILPKTFLGTIHDNQIIRDGQVPFINKYSENEINKYNSSNFMSMFYDTRTKEVRINDAMLLDFASTMPLSNNFIVTDDSITEIRGVLSTYVDLLGDGTILSIKNKTSNEIQLINKHWTGKQFIFRDDENKTLKSNETIIFIVKDKHFYELI